MTNTDLKSIRESLNLSKTDLAKMIGISPVMEGKYEKGSTEIPEEVVNAINEVVSRFDAEKGEANEESTPAADKEPAVKSETMAQNADQKSAAGAGASAIPLLLLAPVVVPQALLTAGFILRPRWKMGIFGPWV